MPVTVSTARPRAPGGDVSAFPVLAFPGGGSAKPSTGLLTLSLPRTHPPPSASRTPSRGLASPAGLCPPAPADSACDRPGLWAQLPAVTHPPLDRPLSPASSPMGSTPPTRHAPAGCPGLTHTHRRLLQAPAPLALLLGSLPAPHYLWPLVASDPMTILEESDSHTASSTHDWTALTIFIFNTLARPAGPWVSQS